MIPKITLENGESIIAYEIGMLVKETREDWEDRKESYFHVYVIGDYFHNDVKKENTRMHWTLIDLEIE